MTTMENSSDEDVSVDLLPPKKQKRINFAKCLICQRDTHETLLTPRNTSVDTFVCALKQREDDVHDRLVPYLENISSMDLSWHHACYSTYTSRQNLSYTQSRRLSALPIPSATLNISSGSCSFSGSRKSRSQCNPTDWSKCIFCKCKTHKKVKEMATVSTYQVSHTIQKAAEARGDDEMLSLVASVNSDLIAAKAKYHKACFGSYVSFPNLTFTTVADGNPGGLYASAFDTLVREIAPELRSGKAFDMATLLDKYKGLLYSYGIAAHSYTTQKLKLRMEKCFRDEIVFHKQHDRTKPEMVYSSSISLQDVFNAAYQHHASSSNSDQGPSNFVESDRTRLLYRTAKLIKSDINSCQGISIKPPNVSDLSLAKSKSSIPDSLYWLLRWIITNPEKDTTSDELNAKECDNKSDERRVLTLAQDIVYCASHARVKMPKHVSLGMAIRHLTGSKELISILNRLGHCTSYDDVEIMDTSLAREVLAESQLFGAVIPTNISPGLFVQAAADNNDINEETIDGTATTHATTLVLYQSGQFGQLPQTALFADHSERTKSLKYQEITQTKLEFSAFGKKPSVSSYVQKMQKEWFVGTNDLTSQARRMDSAWAMLRMCPTKLFEIDLIPSPTGEQTVPSWSGFNAMMIYHPIPVKANFGYCPMVHGSSTEYSTVYTVMKTVQAMMKSLGQKESVITFDLAIYVKAKEIQWRQPEEFSNTVLRLGGFHIILNYLAVVGKKYEGSGLEDLLVESGVYGSGTVAAIMRGKFYNRTVRAHKLVMETLFRLMWRSFVRWMSDRNASSDGQRALMEEIVHCQTAVRDGLNIANTVELFAKKIDIVESEFNKFREECSARSHLFAFWNDYIDMVQLLLQFLRAERSGNWLLHLSTTAAMTPYFFAFDRPNYSKWLPVYLADMNMLPESHPEVYQEFMNGNHSVSRSKQPFSRVSTDMALEQSINRDSKTKGGIVGITKQQGALERWFLTSHQRAAITTALKEICGMPESDGANSHKEATITRIKKDEEDVQRLLASFTLELMTDPFILEGGHNEDNTPLINFATGVVMPPADSSRLLTSFQSGSSQMSSFIEQRLNTNEKKFWDPLGNLKIKTFASFAKKKKVKTEEKIMTISADRNLFGRLIIAAKTRDVQLKKVLCYELSSVPFSIAHTDGRLRKTNKSVLLAELENNAEVHPHLPLPPTGISTAYVIDGMAMVQMIKAGGVTTFGKLAEKHYSVLTSSMGRSGCRRVDVVFDRYIDLSTKGGERLKRGASEALEVQIQGSATKIPKQWQKYIANPQNKTNLSVFLASSWERTGQARLQEGQQIVIGGGYTDCDLAVSVVKGHCHPVEELQSDHEEADTRLLLHAKHASQDNDRIVVQSPDTDVAVLCVSYFSEIKCRELWFRTGVKDNLRFIPIHHVAEKLGPSVCDALPALDALTGCDSTSSLSGIGKKKALGALLANEKHHEALCVFGKYLPLSDATMQSCEAFICQLYTKDERAGTRVNDLRYWLFCQNPKKNEELPPTSDSLQQHMKRANYQTFVWRKALEAKQNLASPTEHGWKNESGVLQPVLMTKEPAPSGLLELTFCRCKKSACSRRDCSCKANNLACTEACQCFNSEECQNPLSQFYESDESDEDS